jgi:hypothetical protein
VVFQIAKVVHPAFLPPTLPDYFNFETETITSDGPYGSSENFYYLDYNYFKLTGEKGFGFKIYYEDGRQDGDNPVSIETLGFSYGVSSHIYKSSTSPRAFFYVWQEPDRTAAIEKVFARHQESCVSNSGA